MRGGCTGAAMRHVPNQPVRIAGRPSFRRTSRPTDTASGGLQQVQGSAGNAREARLVLPRGVDDHVYRSITPAAQPARFITRQTGTREFEFDVRRGRSFGPCGSQRE